MLQHKFWSSMVHALLTEIAISSSFKFWRLYQDVNLSIYADNLKTEIGTKIKIEGRKFTVDVFKEVFKL